MLLTWLAQTYKAVYKLVTVHLRILSRNISYCSYQNTFQLMTTMLQFTIQSNNVSWLSVLKSILIESCSMLSMESESRRATIQAKRKHFIGGQAKSEQYLT